jgi:thiol:disulfide interchange protein DsbC
MTSHFSVPTQAARAAKPRLFGFAWALAMSVVLTLAAPQVMAQESTEAAIKLLLEQRLRPGTRIDGVRKTPYFGLYEARIGSDIIYTDEKVTYMLMGEVIDGKTFENYTRARIEELQAIRFDDLPLQTAIKVVKGNGKRRMAYFSDPNCGFCKKFERETLADVKDATIYIFLYPILSEDSTVKAKQIWCAPNREKAYDEFMRGGKPLPSKSDCDNPIAQVVDLGRRLNITGTPTTFFDNGQRLVGAAELNGLERRMNAKK